MKLQPDDMQMNSKGFRKLTPDERDFIDKILTRYHHARPDELDDYMDQIQIGMVQQGNFITVVLFLQTDDVGDFILTGTSKCHPGYDEFDSEIGTKIALGRAVLNPELEVES